MMMELMYLIPLGAWLAFVYFQHNTGDRPTTYLWQAVMAGLGTFECTKGLFALAHGVPATTMAFAAGLAMTAGVLVVRARRQTRAAELGLAA